MKQPRLTSRILVILACLLTLVICRNLYRNYLKKSLDEAVASGDASSVRVLLDKGAGKDASNLVLTSVQHGDPDTMRVLLEHRRDINLTDITIRKAFLYACDSKTMCIVRLLLENEAWSKIVAPDKKQLSAIANMAANEYNDTVSARAILHILRARGIPITLAQVAKAGDIALVQSLLREPGANVNARDKEGSTPLFTAVERKRVDVVKLLLEQGADPNAKTIGKFTPWKLAQFRPDPEIVALLKKAGAKE